MHRIGTDIILSPSDVNDFLACRRIMPLNLAGIMSTRTSAPVAPAGDEVSPAELVARKGDEHEARYVADLERAGRQVVKIAPALPTVESLRAAEAATLAAMRSGADLIYQATFFDGRWRGHADFLERVAEPSKLGKWSYEAVDAKLARHVKPYFLVQLAFYSEQVERLQGRRPERMSVVLGTREQVHFRVEEFSAHYRHLKRQFEAQVAAETRAPGSVVIYPYPVGHCGLCRWDADCADRRERDDHLSAVANIRRDQMIRLEVAGVRTLAKLGGSGKPPKVPRMVDSTLDGLRQQARLQLSHRQTGAHKYEILEPEEGRGFALLPEPSPGDVFFDMEGNPYAEGGLEYLFGAAWVERGKQVYEAHWAHDRREEKKAFEALVDLVVERRRKHPKMHVYHYAAYEPTALKRLMGTHGTREDEIDDLLRGEVFVDLYTVVRQAIRISQPSYSIKKVEAFYLPPRTGAVTDAAASMVEYERWMETGEAQILTNLEAYNREDCVSALGLREWLGRLRDEAGHIFKSPIPWRPAPEKREASEKAVAQDAETARLAKALTKGLGDGIPAEGEGRARWLMAQLLEYHRRERRPAWWWHFQRGEASPEDLVEDVECIGDLRPDPRVKPVPDKRSMLHTLVFPDQEYKLAEGSAVHDPLTGDPAGDIESIDVKKCRLVLRRGPSLAETALPRALVPRPPLGTDAQEKALRRLASAVLEHGTAAAGPYRAARAILARALPRVEGVGKGQPLCQGRPTPQRIRSAVEGLRDSYLFIQGPPGSGKTWTGAGLAVHLMKAGKRVGVTSNSHKAIHNFLDEVEQQAEKANVTFRGLKKASATTAGSFYESPRGEASSIENSTKSQDFEDLEGVDLVAGTSWLFADERLDGVIDYLFIDEAGQVALANTLAMATAARNVVLLGDPLQLAQVSQGAHPEGAGVSVLDHLLGDAPTIAPERGIFLDRTRRMHPDVCRFVSDVVYGGKLESEPFCAVQDISSPGLHGTGLRWLPVEHDGNRQSSPEEAKRVTTEIARLLDGGRVTGPDGKKRRLTQADIMVVAPYNLQVRCVRRELEERGHPEVEVGTVDKFQGREAPVVFFTMATSTGEDIPRNIDFLFSRNRLNVAISRARCLAVIVASPRLLEVNCRTPDQIRLVNAVCRFVEDAGKGASGGWMKT